MINMVLTGVCHGVQAARAHVDQVAKGFDKEIKMWKKDIEVINFIHVSSV